MIPALSLHETRCQLLCERSGEGRQGRSKTRNSNSGHRVADSPAYSDAQSSYSPCIASSASDAPVFRFCVYRSRFITNARQPANNPPPKIVVPNERYALASLPEGAPSSRSRTPPCTISTERVSNAPMANHHLNDLTDVPETERHEAYRGADTATLGHCSRGSRDCQED